MSLFIDFHQYRKIARVQSDVSAARNQTRGVAREVADLDRRVDRLSLVCEALWELLKESTGLTEEAVYQKMEEIDLRDGKLDGKISRTVLECDQCGRAVNSRRPQCIYCGHRNRPENVVG